MSFLMRWPILTSGASISIPWATSDRKSTRLNSSHGYISYAVFCLKKKKHSHVTPNVIHKVDQFAVYSEKPPRNASVVCDLSYHWGAQRSHEHRRRVNHSSTLRSVC